MPDNSNVTPLNALDPSSFRVPASDAKGHSVPKSFRMMPVLWSAINVMVNSHVFPYKDVSEFIRHALMRQIKWCESIGEVPSVSGQVEAANAVLREHQMYEEYQELFTALRTRIQDCLSRQDQQEARRLVTEMRGHFNRMPEGYWKTQYERQLKEHDHLFINAPKVKLAQLSNE